ncbi:MAG: hypothetical protein WA100_01705 [Microgenomates group bacterium]
MKKIFIVSLGVVALLTFLGRELNPLDLHFFKVHDNTQVARLSEFAFNLKSGIIPPRIAPHFSFNHGFPVFNFYAPFSYWIGGIMSLVVSPAIALKALLLLGLIFSFVSMFVLIASLFPMWTALLSASVYSSSLWMAVEIFVRGNVGEVWFMALFPLALFFLTTTRTKNSVWFFIGGTITIAATLTVHNVLSLVSLLIFICLLLIIPKKKTAMSIMFFALLISASFLFPALVENRLTYASSIASKTNYADHFLCPWQLWKAQNWSYGGSGIGCMNDDMSFQLGKPHIILGLLGLVAFLYGYMWKRKGIHAQFSFYLLAIGIGSTFLTLPYSKPVWDLLSPVMKVFQFPWRFIPLILFAISYFSAFVFLYIKNAKIQMSLVIIASLCLFFLSGKFFSQPWKYSLDEYTSQFLTEKYIERKAAYEIPEYFPRTGSYEEWRTYEKNGKEFYANPLITLRDEPFNKQYKTVVEKTTLPLHYFPVWHISIAGKGTVPQEFDSLGRPQIVAPIGSIITVIYGQTAVEMFGTILTLIGILALVFLGTNKNLWQKLRHINN